MIRAFFTAALAGLALTIYCRSAYAYIDPGSVSLLLQGAIGAVAVGLVALKLYWQKVKALFAGRAVRSETDKARDDR
jgi:hypothetical protein